MNEYKQWLAEGNMPIALTITKATEASIAARIKELTLKLTLDEINASTELQAADGQVMTAEQVAEFIETLP